MQPDGQPMLPMVDSEPRQRKFRVPAPASTSSCTRSPATTRPTRFMFRRCSSGWVVLNIYVYGYARSRKVVWAGFGALAFATLMSQVVLAMPPASNWTLPPATFAESN